MLPVISKRIWEKTFELSNSTAHHSYCYDGHHLLGLIILWWRECRKPLRYVQHWPVAAQCRKGIVGGYERVYVTDEHYSIHHPFHCLGLCDGSLAHLMISPYIHIHTFIMMIYIIYILVACGINLSLLPIFLTMFFIMCTKTTAKERNKNEARNI